LALLLQNNIFIVLKSQLVAVIFISCYFLPSRRAVFFSETVYIVVCIQINCSWNVLAPVTSLPATLAVATSQVVHGDICLLTGSATVSLTCVTDGDLCTTTLR